MAQVVAVLSSLPKLSHHLRALLPNLIISYVLPDKADTLAKLNAAEILVADCDLLAVYADKLTTVKWVQSTWAGLDKLLQHVNDKNPNYILTRFSDQSFGLAMSEYVIAHIFNHERNQREQYKNQDKSIWCVNGKISQHRLISDLNIGILGLGNIGKTIAEKLKMFGATVWGMTRTEPKERSKYIDEYRTSEKLFDILENCDYIINVLPTTDYTRNLLSGNVLEKCKEKSSVFINIGRGTIVDETDLINAIEQKWISAAILDVFQNEPLPQESKLWKMPQVTISPHISGITRAEDVAKVFAMNYERYIKNENLLYTFDWNKGY